MRRRLTDDEFYDEVIGYEVSAFRLEQQPAYDVTYESAYLGAFLAGRLEESLDIPSLSEFLTVVAARAADGHRMVRVRVRDDPPTDYQRWLDFVARRRNIPGGEVIRYASRPDAEAAGFNATQGDWWLLDESRVIDLQFDDDNTLTAAWLTDEADRVAEAIVLRDRAVEISMDALAVATG